MLNDEFLDNVSDFYGNFTVDELAERLGVATIEIMEYLSDLIDDNLLDLEEEMGYNIDGGELDEEED